MYARLAGRLIHPNIIATFDIDEDRGYRFISTEFIQGKTLAAMLEEDFEAVAGLRSGRPDEEGKTA